MSNKRISFNIRQEYQTIHGANKKSSHSYSGSTLTRDKLSSGRKRGVDFFVDAQMEMPREKWEREWWVVAREETLCSTNRPRACLFICTRRARRKVCYCFDNCVMARGRDDNVSVNNERGSVTATRSEMNWVYRINKPESYLVRWQIFGILES